ncbi:FAD-binding Berberine family protein [Rhynchospora pubera]|uniref:FAD-binding Berberine family protein n=1 Tax=Rhynchospora pubera TaxID=906938 RepID=A0AAV8ETB3_9POAL|nr:FAD-binding Berberine family protein [Rhynchospora pubera]
MAATTLLLLSLLLLSCCHLAKPQTRYNKFTSSQDDLAACLTDAGIHNFSLYDTPSYYSALNVSIQNLRFVGPTIRKPVAIVIPSSQLHLKNAILCMRTMSLKIRLRSGGHSYEGLSYTAEESSTPFAVIDLMNLNKIQIDLTSQTAWVEAGATLGELYYAISESSRSLAFSAGSCPTVGSGGHIAGGGFGLLSRKYGLAADNVIDAVLIDPSGRVMNRTGMSEDLFWAIRGGGGGNWGAVYSWHVQLVPVPDKVSAFVLNRHGSVQFVAELVNIWQSVAPFLPDEFYLSAFVGAGLPECNQTGTISVTFKGLYLGPKQEALRILERRFPQIGMLDLNVQEMSWIESVLFFSGLPNGSSVSDLKNRALHSKTFFKAKSDYVQVPISKEGLIGAINFLSQEPKAYVILDPYGGVMDRVGSSDLPFPHRKGNLYSVQYMIEWTAKDDPKRKYYMNWIRFLYNYMQDYVSKNPRAAFVNYLDLDLGKNGAGPEIMQGYDPTEDARAWGERYFMGNYDRLVRVKTAVDPYNVFSNAQSVPPDFGLWSEKVKTQVTEEKISLQVARGELADS